MDTLTDPAISPASPGSQAAGASPFVWCILAAMVLADLGLVGKLGSNLPFFDEWDLVPALTGNEPITIGSLWAQHNEHRIPLPRLILVGLAKITNMDFRAAMVCNVLLLGGLAGAMVVTSRRIRGWTSYTDAFFPLALLHWGHNENLLWGFQIAFVLSTTLAGIILLCVVRSSRSLEFRPLVTVGVCLTLLPLCGAAGLPFVPFMALWLAYCAFLLWRASQPHAKRQGVIVMTLSLTSLLVLGLYFYGYTKPPHHRYSTSIMATLETAQKAMSMSLGPVALSLWPYAGLLVMVLLLSGAAGLLVVVLNQSEQRACAWGLLLYLGACGSLALALGWGRAVIGGDFLNRYVTLAIPVLCCVYFTWIICRVPAVSLLNQMFLFTLFCMLLPMNTLQGYLWAVNHRQKMDAFVLDLKTGVPSPLLAEHHAAVYPDPSPFIGWMHMLRQTGVSSFRDLNETDFEAVPFPSQPIAVSEMTWDKNEGIATGTHPSLVFALPHPRFVYCIRLTCSLSKPQGGPATLRTFWKNEDQKFSPDERNSITPIEAGPEETSVTLWVNGWLDQFRMDPDTKPCFFHLSTLEAVAHP